MPERPVGDAEDVFDVIVAGGGIAGMTAAVGLADAGLRVLLLERDQVLGGRARSFTEPATGEVLPIGPHVFLDNYANLRALLERLGTSERVIWDDVPCLAVVEGARVRDVRLDRAPAPLHFLPALRARSAASASEVSANLPALLFALQVDESDVLRLDEIDARTALRRLGVPERSLTSLWSFIALTVLNVPLERCSAGSLFRFCRFLLCRRGPRFGFADRGLGDVFAAAAAAFIHRAGGNVRVNSRVSRIARDGSRPFAVELDGGSKLFARHVVAALPAAALDEVLDETLGGFGPRLSQLTRFEAVPYVSVFLWFDRKLTERRLWARAFRADDFGSDFYDLSNVYRGDGGERSLIAANIIWSHRVHQLDDDRIAEGIRRELAEFLPEARAERVLRRAVHRIPLAVHCPQPGTERLRPENAAGREGLVEAGDWTRTGLPSSMESAARSGWLAAERVLERVGKPRTLAHPPPAADLGPMLYERAARSLPFRLADLLLNAPRALRPWRRHPSHLTSR